MKKKKKKRSSKYELLKVVPYYKKYKSLLFLTVLFCTLYAVLSFFGTMLKGKLLDSFTNFTWQNSLLIAGIFTAVMVELQVVIHFWSNVVLKMNSSVDFDLKHKMLESLMSLKIKNFDQLNSGVFVARINKDSYVLSEYFDTITDDLSVVVLNVTFLIYSFFLNIWLALFMLGNVVFFYFYEKEKSKHYEIKRSKYKKLDETVVGSYGEIIRGIRDIKNLDAKKITIKRIDKEQKNAINAHKDEIYTRRTWNKVREAIKHLLNFAFIGLSCFLIVKNNLTIGNFLILYIYKENIMRFVGAFADIREKTSDAEVSAKRVFEIIDHTEFEKESYGTKHIENSQGKIEFKNVCFKYKEDAELFRNLNFEIEPNKVVAFVGKSGEGKSTIIDLINKNYTVNSGKILIDGVDLNELAEESIRKNISIVPQNPYIFNMSIENNLKLVNPHATMKEIKEACDKAGIHNYIKNLPQKYSTIIGENGILFSGGQRQRLAIARALLKKSKIILFDEATSALDNETQDKIKAVIRAISVDHTVIVVAHRLSTIISSDEIFVLNNHTIESHGTHKELLEISPTYKMLYQDFSE